LINTEFTDACPSLETGEAFDNVGIPSYDFSTIFAGGNVTVPTVTDGRFALSLGYINECIINAAFSFVGSFDVYRYM